MPYGMHHTGYGRNRRGHRRGYSHRQPTGQHCVAYKHTSAGPRCSRFSESSHGGYGRGYRRGYSYRQPTGQHCAAYKHTPAGARCARFAHRGGYGRRRRHSRYSAGY